jgi:ParG
MGKKLNLAARPAAPLALKRLTIDLEAAQHRRFKTVCAQHGLKMADELRRLIDMRIAQIEHRQGA